MRAAGSKIPDAILLDWNMLKMDGYEFLRALRRLPGGDKPKVVFCTTENDVAHIARALHADANEYIMKPFDKDIVSGRSFRKSACSDRRTRLAGGRARRRARVGNDLCMP